MFNQSIPSVTNKEAVVHWFLKHDEKIKNDWTNSVLFQKAKEEILNDLNKYSDASSLRSFVDKVTSYYNDKVLDEIADIVDQKESVPADLLLLEKLLAAKMRILGYFLFKKYDMKS